MADVMRNGCRAGRSVMDVSPTQRAQGQSGRAGESGPADRLRESLGGSTFSYCTKKSSAVFSFCCVYSLQPQ